MFTNTYNPHVGGVARSVDGLAVGLRTIGHQVLVVASKFPDAKESTDEIVRMSALQDFTGSDFALPSLPQPVTNNTAGYFCPRYRSLASSFSSGWDSFAYICEPKPSNYLYEPHAP